MHEGKRSRYSLDTFNWEDGSRNLLEITADKTTKDSTVIDAVQDFIDECESRKPG
jgi:hypothetical protein